MAPLQRFSNFALQPEPEILAENLPKIAIILGYRSKFEKCYSGTFIITYIIIIILVSKSLTDRISNVRISHTGENVSDHSPVELDINLSLSVMPLKKQPPYSCILWNKLTCDQIDLYQNKFVRTKMRPKGRTKLEAQKESD